MGKLKIMKGNVLFQSGQVKGPGFEFDEKSDDFALADGQLERYLTKGILAKSGGPSEKTTKTRAPEKTKG